MKIELATWIAEAAPSVVKLHLQFREATANGTGFLIQQNVILTNYHNFFDSRLGNVISVVAEFDYEESAETTLKFKGNVKSILGEADHDWAVIELESPVQRSPLALGTQFDVDEDDMVVIIQHPNGAFKQFALEPLAVRHVPDQRSQLLPIRSKARRVRPYLIAKCKLLHFIRPRRK